MEDDRKLRALYRLAETAAGADLERVRQAIVRRRSEIELERAAPSAWDGLPGARPAEHWSPDGAAFTPAARDAVPRLVRREGERGFRVAGPGDGLA